MSPEKPRSTTAPALLVELAERHPDHEFVVDGATRYSYAEFLDEVRATAGGLHALGIGPGSRVGILMDNRHEWLTAYFSAMWLGAEVVALNTWATGPELAYQLRHSRVDLLVAEGRVRGQPLERLIASIRECDGGLDCLDRMIVVTGTDRPGWMRFEELANRMEPPVADMSTPDGTACILYTSGSTAAPKGVPLQHWGLIANMWSIGERMHLTHQDRLWLAVSLFWSFGCVNALFAVMTHGGTVVLQHQFEADLALRLIESERCTVFYGTPNMAQAMAEQAGRGEYDLTSLRTGATIGTAEQIGRIVGLGATQICNVYGLTEAYGNSAVTDALMPLKQRLRCSGPPLDGVAIRILDPVSGDELPSGSIGEIAVRGHLTPGYLDAPELTEASLDRDGYFLTGDLGFLDPGGNLVYQGRLKELIKTGGINVSPAEVESVLVRHPSVDQAFVTGIPDPKLDEAIAAVVIAGSGLTPTADELSAHCRRYLAAYKMPRQFRFVPAGDLPLTSTGKLRRNRLPDLF